MLLFYGSSDSNNGTALYVDDLEETGAMTEFWPILNQSLNLFLLSNYNINSLDKQDSS